jgi:hypothetical protein
MRIRGDTIQFLLLIVTGIGMLGGFWGYCEGHFATKESIMWERDERKELKAEVDALYLRAVPDRERIILRHPGSNRAE